MGSSLKATNLYTTRIDSKKRLTLRKAMFSYYLVKEYENGCIILEPREIRRPSTISANTLKMMDKSIMNFNKKKVSKPIDLSLFK